MFKMFKKIKKEIYYVTCSKCGKQLDYVEFVEDKYLEDGVKVVRFETDPCPNNCREDDDE